MSAEPINYDLTILMAFGFYTMIDKLHRHLVAVGFDDVRPAHGFVFQIIAPNGASATDIARFLAISKQAASEMVDFLEQHGYISRSPDPQDKRGKIITLTERGWACVREVEATLTRMEAEWAQVIGQERLSALTTDLRRMVTAANNGSLPAKSAQFGSRTQK